MVNSFDLSVFYENQQHSFQIGPDVKSLKDILQLIGKDFDINMDNFVVEVHDTRYKLYIVLDKYYFDEMQFDSYFAEKNTVDARVRSRKQSAFNMVDNIDRCPQDANDHLNVEPDHVVVWLDKCICQPGDYQMLKQGYNNMITLDKMGLMPKEINYDIEDVGKSIQEDFIGNLIPTTSEGPILYTFSDVRPCIKFINRTSELRKTIFLITSPSLGRKIIPQIYDNIHIHSIYILAFNFFALLSWVWDYIDKLQIFDHDRDLFSRLARDIADYYTRKGFVEEQNPRLRLSFLNWAAILYKKADKNDGPNFSCSKLKPIEECIEMLRKLVLSESDSEVRQASDY